MPKLFVEQNGQTVKELPLGEKEIVAGRALECDIVIMDHLASRRHATIQKNGDGWRVTDLNSSNGVFVNEQRIRTHQLKHGDKVRIGHSFIRYHDERPAGAPKPKVTLSEGGGGSPGMSMVTRVADLRPELAATSNSETVIGKLSAFKERQQAAPAKADAASSKRDTFHFFVLFQLVQLLNSASSLEDMYERALEMLVESLGAVCGTVLLVDKTTGELRQQASRDKAGAGGEVKVSRTIVDQVIRDKVAILTRDAQSDARFQHGQSIAAMQIRSAICVPIWDAEEVDGCIYLVGAPTSLYGEPDRDLVTAFGHQLAVAARQDQMRRKLQAEAQARSNLERYHSPDVVEALLRGGGEIGLDVREADISVLFVDIEGFTVLSNRLPAKDVANILNGYFEGATESIFRHRGQVNKYIGDAILAVFGAPIPNPNHGVDAVNAALDMIAASKAFVQTLAPEDRFRIRVSINSGPAVAGNIGTRKRLEYTVIGNTVNVASRLEKLAPPNGIAVGEDTAKLLGNRFQLRALGPQMLKGVSQALEVYVVEGRAGEGTISETAQTARPQLGTQRLT